MPSPKVLILRSPGANCDNEAAFAFQQAGAEADKVHINALRENPRRLHDYQILVIPGGFSYGDDIAAGKILATQLQSFFADELQEFRDSEKLILGICNGFQVLLKAGLIIPPDEDGPLATLTDNAIGRFQDRWIHLKVQPGKCVFLNGITQMELPVAHGEGNFITRKDWILKGLEQAGQLVLKYHAPGLGSGPVSFPANPNGSQGNVAGVCDASGRVFGLMPHPERHVLPTQHPRWTREGLQPIGDGLAIFRNAVAFFQN
ncbi:MAG: phosphoribosylformylglycinamidine synthase I [Gemmataceae bacterium]